MSLRILAALFVLALVGFLIARFPLATALDLAAPPGVQAASAEGTVWTGRLRGLSYRNHPVGDLNLAFTGTGWRWQLDGDGIAGDGRLSPALGGIRLTGVRAAADLRRLLPDLPVGGTVDVADGSLSLSPGGCGAAGGEVTLGIDLGLAAPAGAAADSRGLVLAGPALCREGLIHLSLAGDTPDGPLSAAVTIDPRAPDRLRIRIDQAGPELRRMLPAAGFRTDGGGFILDPAATGSGASGR